MGKIMVMLFAIYIFGGVWWLQTSEFGKTLSMATCGFQEMAGVSDEIVDGCVDRRTQR